MGFLPQAFVSNTLIAISLILWLIAIFGYGASLFAFFHKRFKFPLPSQPLTLLLSLLLGLIALCFFVQLWNLFAPLYKAVSLIVLFLGLVLFWFQRKTLFLCLKGNHGTQITWNWSLIISFLLALCLIMPLSFFSDSIGDSINYHIQIVTWIQNSPVIFGLANIHGRLGFNGIIYNFYALTDVSQLFFFRSFIGNEIIYTGFLTSVLYIFIRKPIRPIDFYELFLLCSLLPFVFILKWGEFQALYCEGIGAVIGIALFSLLLFIFHVRYNKYIYGLFILAFVIALCATLIKIANFALIIGVILYFLILQRKFLFHKSFLKVYVYLCVFSFIFILPWAIKGMMTSGMIAYPASIGYIESLPWAVSDEQRESEVCWIMSWARAPGISCKEVLANYDWMKNWFSMKTGYFFYFKHFIYAFSSSLLLLVFILLYKRIACLCFQTHQSLESNLSLKGFCLSFIAIFTGIIFWFTSGPDPRFGMVYIIPLLALLFAFNLAQICSLVSSKIHIFFLFLFIATLVPMYKNGHHVIVIFLVLFIILGIKQHRAYMPLFVVLMLIGSIHLYRKDYKNIADPIKIKAVHVQEYYTESKVRIYLRTDEPNEHTTSILYEALPMSPYHNTTIMQDTFLGRTMYFIPKQEKK